MVVKDKIKARKNAIKLACLGFNMSHAVTDHNSSSRSTRSSCCRLFLPILQVSRRILSLTFFNHLYQRKSAERSSWWPTRNDTFSWTSSQWLYARLLSRWLLLTLSRRSIIKFAGRPERRVFFRKGSCKSFSTTAGDDSLTWAKAPVFFRRRVARDNENH